MAQPLILTLACPDRPGITARVTGFLFERGANILDAQQFNDRAGNGGGDRFFMRVVFDPDGSTPEGLRTDFAALADEFAMDWKMAREDRPRRTIILVSKFDHCLGDLLYRQRIGRADNRSVVGDHLQPPARGRDRDVDDRRHPLSTTSRSRPDTKPAQPRRRFKAHLSEETDAELIVLARYMQVLSDEQSAHSCPGAASTSTTAFLPGFKGAQALPSGAIERGVKIIGATAHYVTADLDEGPIIHQDVEAHHPRRHAPTIWCARAATSNAACSPTAVRYCLRRTAYLLNGARTVVFRGVSQSGGSAHDQGNRRRGAAAAPGSRGRAGACALCP
jgi:formyltetrahydrofolate deformylase